MRRGGWIRGLLSKRGWWIGLVSLTISRWVLCAKDEIIALPADSTNYAYMAVSYLSGLPSDRLPTQRPGIGLLAQAATGLGIPYKLFMDILVCLVAYLVAHLIRRSSRSTTLGLLTYAALIFNPWFALFSQTFMSEPATALFLVLLWCAAAAILFLPPRQWTAGRMLPAALASSGLVLLRPEDAVVCGFWLLTAALAVAAWRHHWFALSYPQRFYRLTIALLPIVVVWGSLTLCSQIHHFHYGIPAVTQTDTPGMKALLNALYSIRPTEEIRYAPVTRQTLLQACEQSPTLNRYRERLLDSDGQFYEEAKRRLGLQDEVGTWLNWHLVHCFSSGGSRSESDKQLAAAELNDALRHGRLPRRWARYPVDPLWRQWTREIPGELYNGLLESLWPYLPANIDQMGHSSRNVPSLDQGAFDDGLLRRRGTRNDLTLRVEGHTSAMTSKFRRIRIVNQANDVLGTGRIVGDPRAGLKFEVTLAVEELSPQRAVLVEFLPADSSIRSGPRYPLPLSAQSIWFKLPTSGNQNEEQNDSEEWWNLRGSVNLAADDWRIRIKGTLAQWGIAIAIVLGIFSFGLGYSARLSGMRRRLLLIWLLAGWGLFFGRMGYYVLVEVWLHWGLSRYLGPNHFLVAALLGPTMFVFGQSLRCTCQSVVQAFSVHRVKSSGSTELVELNPIEN